MPPLCAIRILYTLLEQISPNLLSSLPKSPSIIKSLRRNSFSCTCYSQKKSSAYFWCDAICCLQMALTDLFGSMYAFKRDLIVGYFFQMAIAYLGCTLGMDISAFNLHKSSTKMSIILYAKHLANNKENLN